MNPLNPLKRYLFQIFTIHRDLLLLPLVFLEKKGSHRIACITRNFRANLYNYPVRFFYDKLVNQYYILDDGEKHYFGDRDRGFGIYSKGLVSRRDSLVESYHLKHIEFSNSDIVIDCGANYADLFLYFKDIIKPSNYITFEPGKEEFNVIKLNAPHSTNINLGLGNENTVKNFYVNERDADSSFIKPHTYSKVVKMQTTTLSSFIKKNKIKKIKLLKLEAEGFEPEILEGASDVISLIEYVSIDGGFERGVNQDETLTYQTNFLLKNNFKMLKIFMWHGTGIRALFKRN